MQIDEFLELAKKRRSVRRLKPDPVPDELIEKILEAAHWAMSGGNAQPWEFIVVKDQTTKDKLAEIRLDDAVLTDWIESQRVEELRHQGRDRRNVPSGWHPLKHVPVIIVVCGDARASSVSAIGPTILGVPQVIWQNLANANHMIQLAAAACGLGSSWGTVNWTFEGKVKALLGIPDYYVVYALVPIGYPASQPNPPYRRELSEIVHHERYDMSKCRSHEAFRAWLVEHRARMKASYK